jgi:hypothetical protein
MLTGNRQLRCGRSAMARADEVVSGQPPRSPLSRTGSQDPEARLHRRLRDAVTALNSFFGLESEMTIVLRAGIQLCVLELDDHLAVISLLASDQKTVKLQTVAAAIECIEIGVAQYITATTKTDLAAMEHGLAAVRCRLNAAAKLQRSLEKG